MKTSNTFRTLIVVAGLLACSWVANALYDRKLVLAPYEAKAPVLFYAGFDKFLSNVSWMTFVQWQGDDRPMTPARADSLYAKLNALTNLDPLFADAYLDGALSLAPFKPSLACDLLKKALRMGLNQNWKVSFYLGMIYLNNFDDPKTAEPYLDDAAKLPDAPEYVSSMTIHARSRQVEADPVAAMDVWFDYYQKLPANQSIQRTIAAGQVIGFAQSIIADCNTKLQQTTESAKREELVAKRSKAEAMLKQVGAQPPPATQAMPNA
jgi:hypothetical protein